MRTAVLLLVLVQAGVLSAAPYFNDIYWQAFPDLAQAEQAGTQGDTTEKIRAAVTYFFAALEKGKTDSYQQAERIMNKVRRRNRNVVEVQAFYGMCALALAPHVPLATRISKATAGLAALDKALQLDPENVELSYMFLVSVWQVPTWFKNRNEEMRKLGNYWLEEYPKLNPPASTQPRLQGFNNVVLLVLAEVERRLENPQQAAQYLAQVNPKEAERIAGKELGKLYRDLRKEKWG